MVGTAGLMFAACGGDRDATRASPTTGELVVPTTKPETLIIRTWGDPWQSTYTSGPVAAFTEKTEIPVQFDLTDYNEIQAKVQQAVAAGQRPSVDVVLTTESQAFAAGAQGISVPLDRRIVTNFDLLASVGRPADGGTSYVNPTSYTQPVVYAADRVQLPSDMSWNELWDPRYRGRLFVTDTAQSLLLPVAKMLGLDPTTDDLTPVWERIAELQPNIAGAGDEEEFISGVQRGEFDLGITLGAVATEVEGLAWVVPQEGIVMSFESLYVPANLPDDVTYWAQVFVNEVLQPESLTTIAAGINEGPTNPAATVPEFMMGDPAFPFSEEEIAKYALLLDPEVYARNVDEWEAAYTAAIKG